MSFLLYGRNMTWTQSLTVQTWDHIAMKAFWARGFTVFLLTGLRIYTGEYKAQGPT